ncbi:MAG: MarR family transcriptional regulator [Ruthenibacterium sp.]
MTPQEQRLNVFLVQVFSDILRLEEANLRSVCRNLSVSELHVLEAVKLSAQQGCVSMAEVAAQLGITSGTLTVSAKTLEQKGYLIRARGEKDKRRVTLTLTAAALPVLAAHTAFHERMVGAVSCHLAPQQLAMLADALGSMHTFFQEL